MRNARVFAAFIAVCILFTLPVAYAKDEFEPVIVSAVVSIDEDDLTLIAKTMYGECRRDTIPTAEKAAVAWCILNRVDSEDFPDTVAGVLEKNQFHGYKDRYPVTDDLKAIALDVMIRWKLEKIGVKDVGRTLPSGYCFFTAYKKSNRFRPNYEMEDFWDWSLPDPYDDPLYDLDTVLIIPKMKEKIV